MSKDTWRSQIDLFGKVITEKLSDLTFYDKSPANKPPFCVGENAISNIIQLKSVKVNRCCLSGDATVFPVKADNPRFGRRWPDSDWRLVRSGRPRGLCGRDMDKFDVEESDWKGYAIWVSSEKRSELGSLWKLIEHEDGFRILTVLRSPPAF